MRSWVESYEDQEYLRAQLDAKGLVAFVPDGAVLPRAAGNLDTPLSGGDVVAFKSPPSTAVEVGAAIHDPLFEAIFLTKISPKNDDLLMNLLFRCRVLTEAHCAVWG